MGFALGEARGEQHGYMGENLGAIDFDHDVFVGVSEKFKEQFKTHHALHPHVLELFRKYATEMLGRGYRHYSARTILERIRWHLALENTGSVFKLNNNHGTFYSRVLYLEDPGKWREFFAFRTRKGRVQGGGADGA